MTDPTQIDGATVLALADLGGSISSGRTRHVVGEEEVSEFAGLAIARYEGEAGVYLMYCDEEWRTVTDTYHETTRDAIEQAEFEFHPVDFRELRPE